MKFWEALKILTEEGRPIQRAAWANDFRVEKIRLGIAFASSLYAANNPQQVSFANEDFRADDWRVYHETQAEGEEQATGVRASGVAGRPAEVPPPADDKADDQVDGPFNQKVDTFQCEGLGRPEEGYVRSVFDAYLSNRIGVADVIDLFRYKRGYDLKQVGNVLHVTKGVEP